MRLSDNLNLTRPLFQALERGEGAFIRLGGRVRRPLRPLEAPPVPLRVGIERGGERFVEDGSKIDLVVDDGLWPVERAVACRLVDGLRAVFNQMQRPEFDLDGDLERARHGFERDDASLCHARRERPVYG